ncbi:MAG TPA: hypothetical protein V6D19_00335 [Stenomitos sp.]
MNFTIHPKRVARFLLNLGFILAFMSLIGQVVRYFLNLPVPSKISSRIIYLLNIDQEYNIPTFYSATLLLICAALLFFIGFIEKDRRRNDSFYWTSLSFIFIYLTIDELFEFHEAVNEIILQNVTLTSAKGPWEVLGLFLVAIFALFYARFFYKMPQKIKSLCFLAAVLFLIGSTVIEILGVHFFPSIYHQNLFVSEVITTIEEMLEIAGTCTFIYALLLYASSLIDSLHLKFASQSLKRISKESVRI